MERGADPNHSNIIGDSPLHAACRSGSLALVALLVKFHASISAVNQLQSTPLHIAAEYGFSEAVEMLLDAGAAPGAVDGLERIPLQCAIYAGSRMCVLKVAQHGLVILPVHRNIVVHAVQIAESRRSWEEVDILLACGGDALYTFSELKLVASKGSRVAKSAIDLGSLRAICRRRIRLDMGVAAIRSCLASGELPLGIVSYLVYDVPILPQKPK